MDIDKEKLKGLLWAEAASYRADCTDWKRNTEALQDFLGEKTVEEVALELLVENEALRQSVADHKSCIASDSELFHEANLECNRYHSVIVSVAELLGISREEQDEEEVTQEELIEAINELWGQVRGMQEDLDEYKSEHEALRQVLASSHEFILSDARTRRMCDETGQVSPLFPKRVGILAAIDGAMDRGGHVNG